VTAIAGGILISQMGEFSFVIAASAWGLGIIDEQAFQFLTGASLVTLLIAPLLIPRSITLARRLSAILPRSRRSSSEQQGASVVLDNHVIVVGFGPAGRTVSRILADEGRKILVIDANHRLVAAAHGAGYAVATGNAARPDLLRWSGIDTASALVVAAPDHREAVAIVEAARTLAPHLQIVSRTRYNAHTASLLQAGATVAVSEEDGIGHVLADLVTARMKPEGVAGD
jgi:CPA2 family monovalent cation:H+ antiporter-2